MRIFAHWEETDGSSPRHPIVCILNLCGMYSAVVFVACTMQWSLMILPAAVFLQYAASAAYHWLPYSKTRQTLDYMAIAWLIAATYIQFWLKLLPPQESLPQIYFMCGFAGAICVFHLLFPEHGALRGTLYLLLGIAGLILSAIHPYLFTTLGWLGFSFGVALYLLQFAIFTIEKPDCWPGLFGYREVQHVMLLAASDIHLFFAAFYLSSLTAVFW